MLVHRYILIDQTRGDDLPASRPNHFLVGYVARVAGCPERPRFAKEVD